MHPDGISKEVDCIAGDHPGADEGLDNPSSYLTLYLIKLIVNYKRMQDGLSKTFSALADPTRRAILARLTKGEANVTELAKPFLRQMSLPAITKHLKVLSEAGLITQTRHAQWRPCKLNGAPLKDASDWIREYKAFWEESFDRLEDYLKTITQANLKKKRRKRK